jgi:hypothetical protein
MSTPLHARVDNTSGPDFWPPPLPTFYRFAFVNGGGSGFGGLCFGWTQRNGFTIEQEGALRTKTLRKFPFTEAGWEEAWAAMVTDYPELARAVSSLVRDSRHSQKAAAESEKAKAELTSLNPFVAIYDCVLLGGYGYDPSLIPGATCSLHFSEEGLWVRTQGSWAPQIRSAYAEARTLEFSGPGEVRKGGRVIGGGFGLIGAATGMIAASLLNSLTSHSEIQTIIRYEATDLEAFFFYSKATPDKLRMELSEAVSRVARHKEVPTSTQRDDPIADLERLVHLHDSGTLSDEEFSLLKAKLIAKIAGD